MSEDIRRYVDDGRTQLEGVPEPSPTWTRQQVCAPSKAARAQLRDHPVPVVAGTHCRLTGRPQARGGINYLSGHFPGDTDSQR
jgi:hypothetical protein